MLDRITKLEYLMRTKEHRTTETRVEATQKAGRWLAGFFLLFFFTTVIDKQNKPIFTANLVCVVFAYNNSEPSKVKITLNLFGHVTRKDPLALSL